MSQDSLFFDEETGAEVEFAFEPSAPDRAIPWVGLPVDLSPMSHGKNQDEQNVVPNLVDHAIVADPDPERIESCELDDSGRAWVCGERENPWPEPFL